MPPEETYRQEAERLMRELQDATRNPVQDPIDYVRDHLERILALIELAAKEGDSIEDVPDFMGVGTNFDFVRQYTKGERKAINDLFLDAQQQIKSRQEPNEWQLRWNAVARQANATRAPTEPDPRITALEQKTAVLVNNPEVQELRDISPENARELARRIWRIFLGDQRATMTSTEAIYYTEDFIAVLDTLQKYGVMNDIQLEAVLGFLDEIIYGHEQW